MKDDSLSDTQSVGIERDKLAAKVNDGYNVYATRVWNEAIEAAALLAESNNTGTASTNQIRKLKK